MLSSDALAEFLGVPAPYVAKQLQALSRAGIVAAKRGVAGGYRLARTPDALSLWDITAAVEGRAPLFRCTEVRQDGPCGASSAECRRPCTIAAAFRDAESGYRDALAAVPLTDIIAGITQSATPARRKRIQKWIRDNAAGVG